MSNISILSARCVIPFGTGTCLSLGTEERTKRGISSEGIGGRGHSTLELTRLLNRSTKIGLTRRLGSSVLTFIGSYRTDSVGLGRVKIINIAVVRLLRAVGTACNLVN